MANDSNKKYMLVYEPQNKSLYTKNTSHYVINFDISNGDGIITGVTEVEKYKGLHDLKKGKYSLTSIDRLTTNFYDIHDLLSKIGIYDNVYDVFIAFSSKGYIFKLRPIFNNPLLKEKLKLVQDGYVNDRSRIIDFTKQLVDSTALYKTFVDGHYYVSNSFKEMLKEARYMRERQINGTSDSGDHIELYDVEREIRNKVAKYRNYRELLIISQSLKQTATIASSINPKLIDVPEPSRDGDCQITFEDLNVEGGPKKKIK